MSLRRFARPQLWQLLTWLLIAAIVVLSLTPPLHMQTWGAPSWNDKLSHFLAYFLLSAWYAQLYDSAQEMRLRVLFCLMLGAAMEGLQSLTGTRTADWRDMLANGAGAIVGGLTWLTAMAGALQRWDRPVEVQS